jgi:hypothetical protein
MCLVLCPQPLKPRQKTVSMRSYTLCSLWKLRWKGIILCGGGEKTLTQAYAKMYVFGYQFQSLFTMKLSTNISIRDNEPRGSYGKPSVAHWHVSFFICMSFMYIQSSQKVFFFILSYLWIYMIGSRRGYKSRSWYFWPGKGLHWNSFRAFNSKASTVEGCDGAHYYHGCC